MLTRKCTPHGLSFSNLRFTVDSNVAVLATVTGSLQQLLERHRQAEERFRVAAGCVSACMHAAALVKCDLCFYVRALMYTLFACAFLSSRQEKAPMLELVGTVMATGSGKLEQSSLQSTSCCSHYLRLTKRQALITYGCVGTNNLDVAVVGAADVSIPTGSCVNSCSLS